MTTKNVRRLRRYFDEVRIRKQAENGVSGTAARIRLETMGRALQALADDILREQLACLTAEEYGIANTWDDVLELVEGALSSIDGAKEILA